MALAMRQGHPSAADLGELAPPMMELDYAKKPADYFTVERQEMLPFLPPNCRRLLDVGCGAGAFGEMVKRKKKVEVWGVEPVSSVAAEASTKLDHVIVGTFSPQTELPEESFDCIVFNDVLEHMLAPEQALRYATSLLSCTGSIVASIPNIRYLPILWRLAVRGGWKYEDCGVLDRTHVRFFTRSSIIAMFQSEGYVVSDISGINPYQGIPQASKRLWNAYEFMNALFFRKFNDLKFQQFAVVAQPTLP
ncbi:MAG TPA: class I SAM-dependent methyltransferase [Verrucomicrobiae bacterium]|nr:class I SAM-dependent methyltransferase [Verrucomicrobiae bacterium]